MYKLVIITADARLGHVIADEAALCGVPAYVCAEVQSISREEWEHIGVAVVDLDGKIGGSIPEHVRVLGLCRDPEALNPRARRLAHVLYRRPFCMADLRTDVASLGSASKRDVTPTEPQQLNTLTLLQDSRCVLMGNRQISLTEKEYAVLSLLIEKGEQGLSKQELARLLDAEETNEGQVYICRLRQKLENAFGLRMIKTVRNHGYVYVGD